MRIPEEGNMKTKLMAAVLLAAIVVAGCGGAKNVEEKTLLTTLTKAMEAFTSTMNSADTPDAVAGALGLLTGQIEKVMPKMKEFAQKHPDWDTNPPKGMEETVSKFKAASEGLQGAMPKIMAMMQQHQDNPMLKGAVEKFTALMNQM